MMIVAVPGVGTGAVARAIDDGPIATVLNDNATAVADVIILLERRMSPS
jgi:hypothetical protein